MLFNIYYLKYFCDAVKHGGISASAQKNFVTQSAVSQAIKKLEKHFDQKLITHHPNKLILTYEGELLYLKSNELFSNIQEIEDTIKSGDGEIRGKIDFACSHSFALNLLPAYIREFQQLYPLIRINFHLAHTDVIKHWIHNGIIDFGIVLDNEDMTAFQRFEIFEGQYRLYALKGTKKKEDLPFLLSEDHDETRELKNLYYRKFSKPIPIGMEIRSWEVIANFVEEGLGIGFFPDYVAMNRKRLKQIDLGLDPIQYNIFAISSKESSMTNASHCFLSLFKDTCNLLA
jgi:DNA-binding transcriptional LysR family regulator